MEFKHLITSEIYFQRIVSLSFFLNSTRILIKRAVLRVESNREALMDLFIFR